jgi:hypothetical protein
MWRVNVIGTNSVHNGAKLVLNGSTFVTGAVSAEIGHYEEYPLRQRKGRVNRSTSF